MIMVDGQTDRQMDGQRQDQINMPLKFDIGYFEVRGKENPRYSTSATAEL